MSKTKQYIIVALAIIGAFASGYYLKTYFINSNAMEIVLNPMKSSADNSGKPSDKSKMSPGVCSDGSTFVEMYHANGETYTGCRYGQGDKSFVELH